MSSEKRESTMKATGTDLAKSGIEKQEQRTQTANVKQHSVSPNPPPLTRKNSYGSDFYQAENIIGHTGDINKNPTVYYLKDGEHGKQSYGHITTAHRTQDNVGKELVRSSSTYGMTHDGISKTTGIHGTLKEWDRDIKPDKHIHKSRNKFVPVPNETDREKLHQATSTHRDIKDRYVKK